MISNTTVATGNQHSMLDLAEARNRAISDLKKASLNNAGWSRVSEMFSINGNPVVVIMTLQDSEVVEVWIVTLEEFFSRGSMELMQESFRAGKSEVVLV